MSSAGDARKAQAAVWVQMALNQPANVVPLTGDASFRRYFRVNSAGKQYVLMDAPPDRENVQPFLAVRDWMQQAGLHVPQLIAADIEKGFLLLEDFGDVTWAAYLQADGDVGPLFADALRQLHLLQAYMPESPLAAFDVTRMQCEADLFLDWYLPRIAQYTPGQDERATFHARLLPWLKQIAILPRVPVHLDYHSRNLMLAGENGLPLGVIDFQDAVSGPVTYDLASLLYDCYQDYPETLRRRISGDFFAALASEISASFTGFDNWHRAVRLTALQRHIKAIGIFSRLAFRDGKRQFLNEIPLTRKHLCAEIVDLELFTSEEDAVVRRLLIGEAVR